MKSFAGLVLTILQLAIGCAGQYLVYRSEYVIIGHIMTWFITVPLTVFMLRFWDKHFND